MLSCSVLSDFLRPHGLQPTRLLCPWDFPGKNTAVDCHSLLQGIFPTQGSNPGLPHCRQILYQLSHQGSSEVPQTGGLQPEIHWFSHTSTLFLNTRCGQGCLSRGLGHPHSWLPVSVFSHRLLWACCLCSYLRSLFSHSVMSDSLRPHGL